MEEEDEYRLQQSSSLADGDLDTERDYDAAFRDSLRRHMQNMQELLKNNHQQPQNQTQPRTSSDHLTAPAPMDLSATSIRKITDANTCSRCFGRGHWSYDCPTKRDYKPGDPVKRGRGGGRGRGTRGNWRNVEGRATGVELGNAPPPSSPSQASVSENGQQ